MAPGTCTVASNSNHSATPPKRSTAAISRNSSAPSESGSRTDLDYKEAFFEGGRSFYTQTVDAALAVIERLPGRHLYFLDDHLFGDRRFASAASFVRRPHL